MKLKNAKGLTLADAALAIFIVAIFVTINVSLSYNALIKAKSAERSEKATYYAAKIAEYIQSADYSSVEDGMEVPNDELSDLQGGYRYHISVDTPTYENIENPEDLIKIVNITVYYSVGENVNQFELRTIKVDKE